MKKIVIAGMMAAACLTLSGARAQAYVVQDGAANAAIVIRENPPRMTALAALELQSYLEKLSGARLPIVHEPQADGVNLFVGRSSFTDERGISDEGLPHGAFRMVSGSDWLVLVGHDRDYSLPEPFRDFSRPAMEIWEELTAKVTDSKWGRPPRAVGTGRWWNPRNYNQLMTERYGEENQRIFNPRNKSWSRDYPGDGAGAGLWQYDQGGSLYAVFRYLMDLGVRWYMPGELGEVVPEVATIPLVRGIDRTVHPDYALRTFNWSGFHNQPFEHLIWAMRIGMFSAYDVWPFVWSHNLTDVYRHEEMRAAHPEYYALIGGERDTTSYNVGRACYSSEGLIRETVDYARFVFDVLDLPTVDLWPEDGYRHCGCELCYDKSPSEAVWGFVDRVAREVYKTHPDRLITCGAYTPFTEPPESVEKFTPNVGVMLSNVWRFGLDDPERWAGFWAYIEAWYEKVAPGNLLRWENSFHNSRDPMSFPVIQTRAMAAELKALKGMSMGEFHNWQRRPGVFHNPGSSHLTLYSIAQFLWDADQDVDAFLDEYYTLFYGPAREEMKTALEYAQASYRRDRAPGNVETAVRIRLMELLHEARAAAGESVYGERIQLVIDELPTIEDLRRQAYEEANAPDPRENAPLLVGLDGPGPEGAAVHRMKQLNSGEEPEVETTFRVWWHNEALHIEFTCHEPDMENLSPSGAVYDGDSVVMLIETPALSAYHVEVNPDGRVFERTTTGGRAPGMGEWSALAEVETERGEDVWRVRVRLPTSGENGLEMDPNHLIAGDKPTEENPWWVNFGRTRVRGVAETHSAFAPTGANAYRRPDKFARFFVR